MTRISNVIFICVILTFFATAFSDPTQVLLFLNKSFDSSRFTSGLAHDKPITSFGAILGASAQTEDKIISSQEDSSKTEIMKNILAQDFEEAKKRMEEFYQKSGRQITNNSNNLEMIDRLSELLTTPSPTLNPKLERVLAEANNKNYEFLPQQGPAANSVTRIENTSNIGEIMANPKKTHYTIALLGDSMIDTLGHDLPHLRDLLTKEYPDYTFNLLNYGQGGTDLDSGLFRLTNSTNYLGTDYPALLSQKVDILIVESFAYNHWSGQFFDLDRQWLTVAKIIETIKINSPKTKIILAATIAPNTKTFGDGKLNWPKQLKWDGATVTKGYLQNIVNFATSERYPLADAYHPSMNAEGDGDEKYINQGDHIHPSSEGALFFSQKILETIKQNNLIE
jgi:hypothetical protein